MSDLYDLCDELTAPEPEMSAEEALMRLGTYRDLRATLFGERANQAFDMAIDALRKQGKLVAAIKVCEMLRQYHAESTDQSTWDEERRKNAPPAIEFCDILDAADDVLRTRDTPGA